MTRRRWSSFAASCCLLTFAGALGAAESSPPHGNSARAQTPAPSVYAPFAFLIGEWDVGPESGPAQATTRFSWGPGQSYLLMRSSLLVQHREEPHLEGMLMWNGVSKHLDMLLALDLKGGRAQERGSMFVDAAGVVIRDITASYSEGVRMLAEDRIVGPAGATARFRQTYQPLGPDRIRTTLMRETPAGWVPTFPGSEQLVMTRRAAAPTPSHGGDAPAPHADDAPQPATVDIQGAGEWKRAPQMRAYYALTVATFAHGPLVNIDEYEAKSFAIFREFARANGANEEVMVDHLKLIPRQMVEIVKEDPAVLKDYDSFWVALSGPD